MKQSILIAGCMATFLFISCASKIKTYEVSNSNEFPVTNKAIVLSVDEVATFLPLAKEGKPVLVFGPNGKALATQNDDIDGDGKWDELAFLTDIEANSSSEVSFEYTTENELKAIPKRTNVRFGYKNKPFNEVSKDKRLKSKDSPTIQAIYQMEGPAWENNIVGFRNYYDARNGIDIFGKKTEGLCLNDVGIMGQNYHEMSSWGMDILKVGNSLGAGAIALQIGDSLYRIGPCEEGNYHFITEGAVRAIFELSFKGIKVQNRSYDIIHRISIYTGDHFYRSQIWIDGLKGDEKIVTGIANLHKLPLLTVDYKRYKIFATHGKQAFKHEHLGMAILVKDNQFIQISSSPEEGEEIVKTHLVTLKPQQPATFYFVVGWEYQNDGFGDQNYFLKVCKESVNRLQ